MSEELRQHLKDARGRRDRRQISDAEVKRQEEEALRSKFDVMAAPLYDYARPLLAAAKNILAEDGAMLEHKFEAHAAWKPQQRPEVSFWIHAKTGRAPPTRHFALLLPDDATVFLRTTAANELDKRPSETFGQTSLSRLAESDILRDGIRKALDEFVAGGG